MESFRTLDEYQSYRNEVQKSEIANSRENLGRNQQENELLKMKENYERMILKLELHVKSC